MSNTKQTILNPYSQAKDENKVIRVQGFVEEEDYKLVRRSADGQDFLQACIAILWQKFVIELKTYGITDYSRNDDFVEFVNNLAVKYDGTRLDRHGSTVGGPTEGHVPVDGAGLEGVRNKTKGTKNKRS